MMRVIERMIPMETLDIFNCLFINGKGLVWDYSHMVFCDWLYRFKNTNLSSYLQTFVALLVGCWVFLVGKVSKYLHLRHLLKAILLNLCQSLYICFWLSDLLHANL